MSKAWTWIKNIFAAIGVFIAGFFLIRRGIDATTVAGTDPKGKAKEELLQTKSELEKVKVKEKIDKTSEQKKKKAAEDLKKKSKNSKQPPKKKKENLKKLPKKTQKSSQKSSKKGSK